MRVDDLIDDVLALLGENPGFCLPDGGDGTGAGTLRVRIRVEVERCAARSVAETPRRFLTGWRKLPSERVAKGPDGRMTVRLPEDYLMLHSLRLSDWERDATEALDHSHWLRRFQESRWHGLRGTAQRPLVFHGIDGEGHRCLELFPASEESLVAEGWYMPAPAVKEDGGIEIPPAAYRKCLDYIVETLSM